MRDSLSQGVVVGLQRLPCRDTDLCVDLLRGTPLTCLVPFKPATRADQVPERASGGVAHRPVNARNEWKGEIFMLGLGLKWSGRIGERPLFGLYARRNS